MNISNEKTIKSRMWQLVVIVAGVSLLLMGSLSGILPKTRFVYFNLLLTFILLLSVSLLIRLKVFVFENSGMVISIKTFHPIWDKIHFPKAEFPLSQCKSIYIKETFTGKRLELILISEKKKKIKLDYSLKGLNEKQILQIYSSISDKDYEF